MEGQTEINQALSPEARDKLSDITARLKLTRDRINKTTNPEKKPSLARRVLFSMIALPIIFFLFIGAIYFGIWMVMYPLNTTQMSGISIFLIGCYTVFVRGK